MLSLTSQTSVTQSSNYYEISRPREEATTHQVFEAVDSGELMRVAALFNTYDVDLHIVDDHCGDTPLHRAAAHGHDEIVEKLLIYACDNPRILDAKDRNGMTPLMSAAEKPSIPSIIALIVAGASLGQSTSAQYPEIANTDKQQLYDDRISLVKTLIEADGDINLGTSIALKNSAKKVVAWCMKERFRSLPNNEIDPQYIRVDEIITDINNRFFDAFKEILYFREIAVDDLIFLMDDAFKIGSESTAEKLCYLCAESTFINALLEHYAFSGGVQELSMFMQYASLKSTAAAAEVLLNIAAYKDRSQADKISAMQAMGKVIPSEIIDDLLTNLVEGNDPETLKLMASVGINLSSNSAINNYIKAVECRDYKKLRLLHEIGAKFGDVVQFCVENKGNRELVTKTAIVFIRTIQLSAPNVLDNDAKVKEIAKWVGAHAAIDSVITQLMLQASDQGCFENIKLFVDAGAKTEDFLIALCRKDKIDHARKLIRMGGAFGNALLKLRNSIKSHSQKSSRQLDEIIRLDEFIAAELREIKNLEGIEKKLRASIKTLQAKCTNIRNTSQTPRNKAQYLSTWRAEIKQAEERLISISHKAEQLSHSVTLVVSEVQAIKASSMFNSQVAQDDQIALDRLALAIRTETKSERGS